MHLNQLTFHFPTSLQQIAVLRSQVQEQSSRCDRAGHTGSTDPKHPGKTHSAAAVYARKGSGVCGLKSIKPTATYCPIFIQCKLLIHMSNSTDSKEILAFPHQRKDQSQMWSQAEAQKHRWELAEPLTNAAGLTPMNRDENNGDLETRLHTAPLISGTVNIWISGPQHNKVWSKKKARAQTKVLGMALVFQRVM